MSDAKRLSSVPRPLLSLAWLCAGAWACTGYVGGADDRTGLPPGGLSDAPAASLPPRLTPEITLGAAGVRRLTEEQYKNSITDLVGTVTLPERLEPDDRGAVFASINAYRSTTSPQGVDLYREAAFDIANQVFSSEAKRQALVGCTPALGAESACVHDFVASFGRRAWRRPLAVDEVDRYVALVQQAATLADGNVWRGLEAAVSGLLQSVNFVCVPELGASTAHSALSGYEVASRLSYFLWNTTPDSELLDAAEHSELTTDQGIALQASRLLASPRAHDAVWDFFAEWMNFVQLATLTKDAQVYPEATPELMGSLGQEVRRLIDDVAFDSQADLFSLLDTRSTFVDDALARLYDLPVANTSGFRQVTFPADSPRGGLLTLASACAPSTVL